MVGVMVAIDQIGDLVADTVRGGDLVDGAPDVVADRGRGVEKHDTVRRCQERRLVRPVGDPVEVSLDATDVVTVLVKSWAERRPRNRRVVGEYSRISCHK